MRLETDKCRRWRDALVACALAVAVFSAQTVRAANPINLTAPCDLATVTAPVYQQAVNCNVDTLTPFTLSSDVNWLSSSFPLSIIGGRTCFDFAKGGNHTLTVKIVTIVSATAPYVEFKGGVWSGYQSNQGGTFDLATATTPGINRTVVFDGASVTNFHHSVGYVGRNSTIEFKNGASLWLGTLRLFGSLTDATYTNNLYRVSGGSVLLNNASDSDWEASGPGSAALMRNRLIVEGAGSLFRGCRPYGSFNFGRYSSGNEFIVRDGGRAEWYGVTVGGSEYAKSNTVLATGAGTTVEGGGPLSIGTAVGADYNRVVIADGADWKTQIYNGTSVGSSGSHNELVISNATLSRTYWVKAGASAGADYNRVRIYGNSMITPTCQCLFLAGAGRYNEWIFDNATFVPTKTMWIMMAEEGTQDYELKGRASTNNAIRIVNDSRVECYDFRMHVSSKENTLFVGAGSRFAVSHDMLIRGDGNSVIVSNGTIACSRSDPGFRLGSAAATASETYTESGNRLVLQGTCPSIERYEKDYWCTVNFCSRGILRFEVPPEGYPLYDAGDGSRTNAPIFRGVAIYFRRNGTLEFGGVEKLAKRLKEPVEYKLGDAEFSLLDPDPGVTRDGIIESANSRLPACARVYLDESSRLWLRVKPFHGLVISLR